MCERVGVTKGSLYHHFRGKTELFGAVVRSGLRGAGAAADRAGGGRDAQREQGVARRQRRANAALTAFLQGASEPRVQRILFQDGPSLLGWARVREIDRRYGLALVREVLDRLRTAELISVTDPVTMAHLLLATLIEAAQLRASGEIPGARDRVDAELRVLLTGLIGH